ncbi:DNA methyltransferase [Humibacter ginsenosidimutans]|uniref:Helicase C-terminal domain-containing protein n=1 Tax=Humibacter ginsenosidimutans TaxID=2599293 RepID=A0A5B8M874_9MICO|nr:DNA methyltransferase [Humibacter ginsenosidimutans]QDZ15802.1 hypothetical protein FPZ11_14435 [Humibacter ginsenosidimutans]
MSTLAEYESFLAEKVAFDHAYGFEVEPTDVNPILKPHQRDIVRWAVRGGRRAIFARFGLGKSVMQLEILRIIIQRYLDSGANARALIVAPLGVRGEFIRDGRRLLGLDVRFIRRTEEVEPTWSGIYVTNYESVRDGRLDVDQFDAVSLDEAAVLRSFGSKTYQTFLAMFDAIPYRFVATATPSPNKYKELIHYAGFLGVMDTGQALTRFFKRDSTQANNLTLYPHKEAEFWLWLNTWACFLQRPSDLCECSCHGHTWTLPTNDSGASSPSNGGQRPAAPEAGSAAAIAETRSSSRRNTSKPDAPEAADAFGRITEGPEPAPTTSGRECSTGADDRSTRTGRSTAVAESESANGGNPSPTSSLTWESRQQDAVSIASTMTATTSPKTADGQPRKSRQQTGARTGAASSCEVCRCDDGYDLPELRVHWDEVAVDLQSEQIDRDGQGVLVRGARMSMVDAAREKRDTMSARIARVMAIAADVPGQFLVWCDLNDEQALIEQRLTALGISYSSIYGALSDDEAERRLDEWRAGTTQALIGKPVMLGQGMNLQQAHVAIFAGITHKFEQTIQATHRIHRFGQTHPCDVHLIFADTEAEVRDVLERKWREHDELTDTMSDVIRQYGLNPAAIQQELTRSMGVERREESGEDWLIANNDCVPETMGMESNSVDLIVTSIPFSNHYEYTPSYNDFGHTDDNGHFWRQMDYLTPELLRILKPGRIYACHVKDRILFGSVTGAGAPTVSPFHAEALFHGRQHGFDYLGMITVTTDVVRENNQTYRLGYTEMRKDGSKMGVGSPEYILLFRKPQTDRAKGYADERVVKSIDDYSLARWQIDAAADWRSSGNRLLTVDELAQLSPEERSRLFTKQSVANVYDFAQHVQLGEAMAARKALPSTFKSLDPGSWSPWVWHDVNRMLTLNGEQARRNLEFHICPLQFDIVDRLIERFSNRGDLVFDPFGGLGTVPLRARKLGRRGRAVELNPTSYRDAVAYQLEMDRSGQTPTLFDLLDMDGAA